MSTRCPWVDERPIYIDYHDKEWGKPQFDSQKLFEKICFCLLYTSDAADEL